MSIEKIEKRERDLFSCGYGEYDNSESNEEGDEDEDEDECECETCMGEGGEPITCNKCKRDMCDQKLPMCQHSWITEEGRKGCYFQEKEDGEVGGICSDCCPFKGGICWSAGDDCPTKGHLNKELPCFPIQDDECVQYVCSEHCFDRFGMPQPDKSSQKKRKVESK